MKARYFAVIFAYAMRFYGAHRAQLAAELPGSVISALDTVAGMVATINSINPVGPL